MMLSEEIEYILPKAHFNKKTNRWEVRLAETVSESTAEETEYKAYRLLLAYHEAARIITTPLQIMKDVNAKDFNYWKQKAKELQAENERLKEIMKNATLDYGYANGWGNWEPILVKECKEKGHKPNDKSTKAFGHDNIVWCDICRYSYKYDSS